MYALSSQGVGDANASELPRSNEDETVWRVALAALADLGRGASWRSSIYEEGFNWLLQQKGIPTKDQINKWLADTGWCITYTQGYLDIVTYQRLLSENICPVAQKLRRLRDIDHSAAPDFLHDVVGHLPLLFDTRYSALLQEWGARGLGAAPTELDIKVASALAKLIAARERDETNPVEITELTRVLLDVHGEAIRNPSRFARFETFYTWAIEFGVVQRGSGFELLGAAALSSSGDLGRFERREVRLSPFRRNAVGRPVNFAREQDCIFVAASFQDYFDELREI